MPRNNNNRVLCNCMNMRLDYIHLIMLALIIALVVIAVLNFRRIRTIKRNNNNKEVSKPPVNISDKMVKDKYESLTELLGEPTYIESCAANKLKSATWMSPLHKFNDFGKYNGVDYIKIHGYPAKKYHPHKAVVFLIVGKYIKVPEHLFGPLKYASETINIEQLFIPRDLQIKYGETGQKDMALVTGSCASVTISVITVKFVMDMIEKYGEETGLSLELYDEFRNEYDRRIHNYLCGKGIEHKMDWFTPDSFGEPEIYNIGAEKCSTFQTIAANNAVNNANNAVNNANNGMNNGMNNANNGMNNANNGMNNANNGMNNANNGMNNVVNNANNGMNNGMNNNMNNAVNVINNARNVLNNSEHPPVFSPVYSGPSEEEAEEEGKKHS